MRAPPPNPPSIHSSIHSSPSFPFSSSSSPPPNYCLFPFLSPLLPLSLSLPHNLSLIHSPLILTLLSLVFKSSPLFSPSPLHPFIPPFLTSLDLPHSLPHAHPPASLPHIFSMPWLPDRTGLAGAVDLSSVWSECHAVVGPALTPIFRCVCE